MVFELSGSYDLILPLLLSAVISTLVSDVFHQESIYHVMLSRRGQTLFRLREIDLLQTVRVREVMDQVPQASLGAAKPKLSFPPPVAFVPQRTRAIKRFKMLAACGAAAMIAGAAIISVLTGAPRWVGSVIGGGIMTIYFTAGGLLGTAWVNTLQLIVMLVGFSVAVPFAVAEVGGASAFLSSSLPSTFVDLTYSSGPGSGWTLLALTGP